MRHLTLFVFVFMVLISTAACTNRVLPVAVSDAGFKGSVDAGEDYQATQTDACVLPEGYCELGDPDGCPDGLRCSGCFACKGLAYFRCGCAEIVPCPVCSSCIGRCVPNVCAETDDCPTGEYCDLDALCVPTPGGLGECRPKPEQCPDYMQCPQVCGCDGKTYCDSCQAHAAGVSVATQRACLAASCAGLDGLYLAEVKAAKTCCPDCAALQCTVKVQDALACPCDTYVNAPTPKMKALEEEWGARACPLDPDVKCKSWACSPLTGADCSSTGQCVDL